MRPLLYLSAAAALGLSACTTVPEAPLPPVVIDVPPVQTCSPVSTLVRQVIPAETKTQTAITAVDNPPYEPIETRVTRTIVVKQAQVFYTNSEGREVLDICETNIERGLVGPAPGEIIPDA